MLVVPLFKKRVRRVCPNYTCFLNLSHDCSLPLWCHFQSTATGKMVITWDGQKKQKPGVFYMLNSHFTSATLIRLPCLDERGWAAVEHIIAKTFLLFTSPFSFFIQCVCYIYNIKTKHNSVFPRHHPPPPPVIFSLHCVAISNFISYSPSSFTFVSFSSPRSYFFTSMSFLPSSCSLHCTPHRQLGAYLYFSGW